jgi:esterase/lipase superfamily enzyme
MSSTPEAAIPTAATDLQIAALVWQGTELVASPAAFKFAAVQGYSFMISNREQTILPDSTYPIANGEMNWYLSSVQANDPNVDNFKQQGSTSATAPASFLTAITNVLTAQTPPRLTVFIHGLGTLFENAIWGTSAIGANLAEFAQYPGLVIGFDWPSFDATWSGLHYASNKNPYVFPPKGTQGTIRDNINGSRPAFTNLLTFLTTLKSSISGLTISLICHSEGNYMAELGFLENTTQYFDHILLVAADINNAAVATPISEDGYVGQGYGIVQAGGDVTVYFNGNDDVLPISLYAYEYTYHNPEFGSRLGSAGPSYNAGGQPANVYSVDCSGVINVQNFQYLQGLNIIPTKEDGGSLSMHTSYLYIPQVIKDMAAVITDSAPGTIANRAPTADQGGYFMELVNS